MFIWLCTTCPIGKHYKPIFIESTDSTLKPIPGSDSCKANQTHCNNYLPHSLSYALNTHHNHILPDITSHNDNNIDRKDLSSSKLLQLTMLPSNTPSNTMSKEDKNSNVP